MIPLFRGNKDDTAKSIDNLLSSFGSLRETRITALIAYLFCLRPKAVRKLLKIRSKIARINIEISEENNRYDIEVKTSNGEIYTIEAKLHEHNISQLKRYRSSKRRLFVLGGYYSKKIKEFIGINHCLNWNDLILALQESKTESASLFNFLTDDLKKFLVTEDLLMDKIKEVHCRDLGGKSLELYFNYHIYISDKPFYQIASECRYFAPYITKRNIQDPIYNPLGLLQSGITYISQIRDCILLQGKEINQMLRKYKFKPRDITKINGLATINHKKEYILLILGEPLRISQSPISKGDLFDIKSGMMPPTTFTFERLFKAINKHYG